MLPKHQILMCQRQLNLPLCSQLFFLQKCIKKVVISAVINTANVPATQTVNSAAFEAVILLAVNAVNLPVVNAAILAVGKFFKFCSGHCYRYHILHGYITYIYRTRDK